MKNNKDIRGKAVPFDHSDDLQKRSTKLEPIKKSGKEKHSIYQQLSLDDGEGEIDLNLLKKKESVLDYFDDERGLEDEEWDGNDVIDDDEVYYEDDEEEDF